MIMKSLDTYGPCAIIRRMSRACVTAALLLAGCQHFVPPPPKVDVVQPTSRRPQPVPVAAMPANGSIYRDGGHRPLFEDRRARFVGDVLTVQIQENTSAKQSKASTLDKEGSLSGSVTALPLVSSAATLAKLGVGGSSANTMTGKGDTAADNTFVGTITVTVVEVLPNGNLVVSGEKQIGINQNADTLRFSGVVYPANIQADNSVLSSQIADARLQVRGEGDIDRAQTTGWLSRFFLTWMPF
jgi:flagellar L-ring protein precursor FlgH